MQTLSEKRVYDDRVGARTGYVASETGLLAVRVTGTSVGEFSLVDRRPARDVALVRVERTADVSTAAAEAPASETTVDTGRSLLVVATDEDVLLGDIAPDRDGDESPADPTLTTTGFGPAVAVGASPGILVAASPGGDLRRLEYGPLDSPTGGDQGPGTEADERGPNDASDGGGPDGPAEDWESITAADDWDTIEPPADWGSGDVNDEATMDGERVTAVSTPLVGTDRDCYRLDGDTLHPVGLEAVRSIATGETPLVGTEAGLYGHAGEWIRRFDGPVDAITTVETAASDANANRGRASVLASGPELYAEVGDPTVDDESWRRIATTEAPVVDLAGVASGHVWALTADGSLVVVDRRDANASAGDDVTTDSVDTREHPLGIVDPRSVVVPPFPE